MKKIHLIMPMGGKGSRFKNKGFDFPKPLIQIHERPFFYWAVQSIVKFVDVEDITFVVLKEHVEKYHIDIEIRKYYPESKICVIPEVLNGAVLTCLEGIKDIKDDMPVLFNDCDHLFCCRKFNEFCKNGCQESPDGMLLTFESDEPKYSFLEYDEAGRVIRTVEKQVISHDAICGAYYFKDAETFRASTETYLEHCAYSEYFVSGVYNVMAADGKDIRYARVDYHVPFGVPEEYETAKEVPYFEELV